MAKTRTPGITILADGSRFIDKRYLGVRIGLRVGAVTQEQAEERLRTEMARIECDAARKPHARPTFTDCAARYLEQSRGKRSFETIRWHVALVQSTICSSRSTSYSIGPAHRPYCASPTVGLDTLWESYGTEEYLVLRGKCMTHRTSHGTGG